MVVVVGGNIATIFHGDWGFVLLLLLRVRVGKEAKHPMSREKRCAVT